MMNSHMTGFVTEQEKSWGLILVVMDDALAQKNRVEVPKALKAVLILVVMDDALALKNEDTATLELLKSLNPCCNG